MNRARGIGLAVLFALSGTAYSGKSDAALFIAGEWYEPANGVQDCGSSASTIIRPMSLRISETACSFRSIRLDDKMVIWRGSCSEGSLKYRAVVVATYNDGKQTLSISFSGGSTISELKRCSPARPAQ